jgi:hypothetical protein
MTTPAVPPSAPNAGPERETMPPPVDPYADAFGDRDATDTDVLNSLFGSVVSDQPVPGVPADPAPDTEDN